MKNISSYIKEGSNVFLTGIGGVSMCSLASVLKSRGINVRGSDIRMSDNVRRLMDEGIEVIIGHNAGNLDGADCVIRTAAAKEDNPEISAARERGLPVFERAEAWGLIMQSYKKSLCIAGTHGKTTTTSMAVSIAIEEGMNPAAMIGGELPKIGASYLTGDTHNGLIIAEADEYCNSFLNFKPSIAVILNVEADHLDFFGGLDDIVASFRSFTLNTPEDGCVIVNSDDINAMRCVAGIGRRTITFGIESGTVRARNIAATESGSSFDITHPGGLIPVKLPHPGLHNVYDALAAAAAMLELGADGVSIARALEGFTGVKRRFEYKGTYDGAMIYDDYAHHPSELRSLLDAAFTLKYNRVIAVFQPHTYSRTKAFFNEFVEQLRRPDLAVVLPIFAARERFDNTISSAMLADKAGCETADTIDSACRRLSGELREGDLLITIGAGEAYLVADKLVGQSNEK